MAEQNGGETESGAQVIHIYDLAGQGSVKVEPGRAIVSPSGRVKWDNLTDGRVTVFFPRAEVFDPPVHHLTVDPNSESEVLTLAKFPLGPREDRTPRRGGVRYIVSVVREGQVDTFGKGGSFPEMIIR